MVSVELIRRDYLRFLDRVLDPTACWTWNGIVKDSGYTHFSLRRTFISGHRAAYEMFIAPIPEGLEIDHLCDNPGCVNPHHLKAVTRHANWVRSASFTAVLARQTHCKYGHVFDEQNTRTVVKRDGSKQRHCRVCSRRRDKEYRDRRKANRKEAPQ